MEVEREASRYDHEAELLDGSTHQCKGFQVGKGKIQCYDVLNHPEHWREE